MTLQAFPGFVHFETHHCVTGSLRHIYATNGFRISEEMLFGLGEGTGYIYWQQKGAPPFMGGRATPEPSLEELAGRRTGVEVVPHTTSSARKAEAALLEMLEAGIPALLQVDMGYLPYFDFGGQEYHFGGHVVVACGYDPATREVLIADRDAALHSVSWAALAQARGSIHKPFPPKHRWCTFDFTHGHPPQPDAIFAAIERQADVMLRPPISNIGVSGIHKTAQLVPRWHETLAPDALKWALFNSYIFISPVGGSGGGMFRYMFSRFLHEAAAITGCDELAESGRVFERIGAAWAQVGDWFKAVCEDDDRAARLGECKLPLEEIAALEGDAWARLDEIVQAEAEAI